MSERYVEARIGDDIARVIECARVLGAVRERGGVEEYYVKLNDAPEWYNKRVLAICLKTEAV